MASIKKAAQWLIDGEFIHRSSASGTPQTLDPSPECCPNYAVYIWADDRGILRNELGLPVIATIRALTAKDWEIYEA